MRITRSSPSELWKRHRSTAALFDTGDALMSFAIATDVGIPMLDVTPPCVSSSAGAHELGGALFMTKRMNNFVMNNLMQFHRKQRLDSGRDVPSTLLKLRSLSISSGVNFVSPCNSRVSTHSSAAFSQFLQAKSFQSPLAVLLQDSDLKCTGFSFGSKISKILKISRRAPPHTNK